MDLLLVLASSHGSFSTLSTGQHMESVSSSFHLPSHGDSLLHGKNNKWNIHYSGSPTLLKMDTLSHSQTTSTPIDLCSQMPKNSWMTKLLKSWKTSLRRKRRKTSEIRKIENNVGSI